MMYTSIQCLSITLSVLLVACTGLLVGVISVLTANTALDTAWGVGNRTVEMCIEGATSNTDLVAGRLLGSILDEVRVDILAFIKHPEIIVNELSQMYREQPISMSLSAVFTDKVIRPIVSAMARTVYAEGVLQLLAQTESGMVASTLADETLGTLPTNGDPIFLMAESSIYVNGSFEFGWDSNYFGLGNSDGLGNIVNRNKSCVLQPNYNTIPQGTMGYCWLPWAAIRRGQWITLHNRAYDNYKTADGILDEPDKVHYSPLSSVGGTLSIFAYGSWTNPAVPDNGYPRRGHRGGLVKVAITAGEISKIMAKQELPDDSYLYAVERNQWDGGAVGALVGVSYGKHQNYEYDSVVQFMQAVPIYVTNQTDDNGNETVIARHGKYALSLPEGYKSLLQNESGMHDVWTDSNTTYWCLTTELSQHELVWYVSLLVPRVQMMGAIDASILTIEETRTKEKTSADRDRHNGYIIMFVTTTVTAFVLVLLSIVLTLRIIKPLHDLEGDMANVAIMRLEAVDTRCVSNLAEVAKMQASFRIMVKNLIEYRNYMPQSVLVSEDDDESTVYSESSLQHTVLSNSRQSMPSTAVLSSDARPSNGTGVAAFADEGLRKKTVSIVCCNISNWHHDTHRLPDLEIFSAHTEYLNVALSTAQSNKGVAETFLGDRIMLTFNAILPCGGHRVAAVNTAQTIKHTVKEKAKLKISYSCTSGEARVGNMGCLGMKRFTLMTTVVPWGVALEAVNKTRHARGLVDQFVYKDSHQKFILRCVDGVEYKKRCSSTIKIYEVMGALRLKEEEWMYQLNDMESNNPYSHWNTAMDMIINKDWDAARLAIGRLKLTPEDTDQEYLRLRRILDTRRYDSLVIGYH
eukprot:TRINITY_DN16585_c0_g1_i1.p1 TRINITY_DN16585_c0_g1~~TRINITY_DN16585_c0_g1_i1.p1  ORF type:complete len:860 (+),score=118.51 TRINITY_DN16585_c0_g1_i1:342-2921(+)